MPTGTPRHLPFARQSLTRLEQLPNIGPSLAASLRQVGIERPSDLTGRDPFALYEALCSAT
ncbi:MAG: helix-hairpin-helix domain-containing protein, partial [Gemmatimonadales bacterium]